MATDDGRAPQAASQLKAVRTFFGDFLSSLVLFALVAGAFGASTGNAFPAPPPLELVGPTDRAMIELAAVSPQLVMTAPQVIAPAGAPTWQATMLLMGLAFAVLGALNLAVVRHLAGTYRPALVRSRRR